MDRVFFTLGAASAFLGVTAGAFGAHALKSRLAPDMLAVFEVAVRYQMYHAFALIVCAWAATKWPGALVNTSGCTPGRVPERQLRLASNRNLGNLDRSGSVVRRFDVTDAIIAAISSDRP